MCWKSVESEQIQLSITQKKTSSGRNDPDQALLSTLFFTEISPKKSNNIKGIQPTSTTNDIHVLFPRNSEFCYKNIESSVFSEETNTVDSPIIIIINLHLCPCKTPREFTRLQTTSKRLKSCHTWCVLKRECFATIFGAFGARQLFFFIVLWLQVSLRRFVPLSVAQSFFPLVHCKTGNTCFYLSSALVPIFLFIFFFTVNSKLAIMMKANKSWNFLVPNFAICHSLQSSWVKKKTVTSSVPILTRLEKGFFREPLSTRYLEGH